MGARRTKSWNCNLCRETYSSNTYRWLCENNCNYDVCALCRIPPESYILCKNGHQMILTNRATNWRCNLCSTRFKVGDKVDRFCCFWEETDCDYDACGRCV